METLTVLKQRKGPVDKVLKSNTLADLIDECEDAEGAAAVWLNKSYP